MDLHLYQCQSCGGYWFNEKDHDAVLECPDRTGVEGGWLPVTVRELENTTTIVVHEFCACGEGAVTFGDNWKPVCGFCDA